MLDKALIFAAILHRLKSVRSSTRNNDYDDREFLNVALKGESNNKALKNDIYDLICYAQDYSKHSRAPETSISHPELLWVGLSLRLEDIGKTGIVKLYNEYLKTKKPLFLPNSPKPKSVEEVWQFASIDRYESWVISKQSRSCIDEIFDRLLHVPTQEFDFDCCKNWYLVREAQGRVDAMVEICLDFGRGGQFPVGKILGWEKSMEWEKWDKELEREDS